jgi:O-acetyl-ADP-ribose deacetylase (regulator of RNase III)
MAVMGDMSLESLSLDRSWTNPSVKAFCANEDPVSKIIDRAREVVLEATDKGWSGPPFDPILLAGYLNIPVVAHEEVNDARTVPVKGSEVRIEYNPNRPRGRMRYSIAHEIVHTFFPDCAAQIRNRSKRDGTKGDDWQLELLCNLGAAELLMPIGSFSSLKDGSVGVDRLMDLRKGFDVSSEAIFLRAVRLAEQPCAMFVASRWREVGRADVYQIDYSIPSRSWANVIPKGLKLSLESVVAECTAIGFTAKRDEVWPGMAAKMHIECVGIPPFPQQPFPRVVGLVTPTGRISPTVSKITYLKGDATSPRGNAHRIVAHVVNDKTPNWGGGFALVVRKKWPAVQEDFQHWVKSAPANLSLGNSRYFEAEPNLALFQMVCQRGYGPSSTPRIRYQALQKCLIELAVVAQSKSSSVHMPRIGCGEAGGSWDIVNELIEDSLCRRGISVTVYDLPAGAVPRESLQRGLF